MEIQVPVIKPRMPNTMRSRFLVTKRPKRKLLCPEGVGDDESSLARCCCCCCSSGGCQKVHSWMIAGKMIARQLEAKAPMSEMNRSKRGMSAAATTARASGKGEG